MRSAAEAGRLQLSLPGGHSPTGETYLATGARCETWYHAPRLCQKQEQKLHSLGLLTASFRPDAERRSLRTLLRHRTQFIRHRAPHILHIPKALQQMNLQRHHVLADITGETGLKIIRAIVAGERDPLTPARLRHPSCRSSEETIYFMLKHKIAYHDLGAQGYEAAQRERELTALQRKAAKLGFDLTPKTAPAES